MEDFGYSKNEEQNQFLTLAKKIFLVGATLFSLACFVYITINSYYSVYRDKNGVIEIVKSPEGPIKFSESETNESNGPIMQINRSIYEDIFGNQKERAASTAPKIRHAPEPAIPINKADSATIQESAPPLTTETEKTPENQKIIIFTDQSEKKTTNHDLLTKNQEQKEKPEKNKPVTIVKQTSANKKRSVRVQIAALTSKNAAIEYGSRLNRLYPNLFSDLKFITEEVNLGKRGVFYRLQVDSFFNQIAAEEFCQRYVIQARKSRADCIVVE